MTPVADIASVHARLAQAMKLHGASEFADAVLAECPDAECQECGRIVCAYGEPYHFHHDGCPACANPVELRSHDAITDGPMKTEENENGVEGGKT